ncbi:MAG: glucose-6-phosphate isomerase [Phycisphaerae bacterium]|nr:glucose-6-phosphate isomerase [Phycisphaerae bacterium]
MPNNGIQLYYRNALADAVGAEHGVASAELDRLAPRIAEIVERIEHERKAGKRRYRDLPFDARMLAAVHDAVRKHRPGCRNLLVLGIGGSALGNIALQTALNPPYYNLLPAAKRPGPRLFVLDNVDPVQFGEVLDLIEPELDATCVNVITKSGETAETAAQFLAIVDLLQRRLGPAARQRLVITTDPATGAMRRLAQDQRIDTLPVPDGVGGRFSVLSAVGLFSAAMCGIDVDRVLAGAARMNDRISRAVLRENPAALISAIHFLLYERGKRLHVMMPYAHQLKDLADWYRQLWAESLGKRLALDGCEVFAGPTPIKALGTTDQHSQVQLYREGPNDKVITFLVAEAFDRDVILPPRFSEIESLSYLANVPMSRLILSEQIATELALVESRRPCLSIRFPRIAPETIGEFIYLYEAATSIMGLLMNIDAYDQPAVQLGKDLTYALMNRRGYEARAAELRPKIALDPNYLV